ncbi:hypothetical protein HDU85_001240 [Gaertneriomyces sp. JEL0708]|nr:hypothetical protein HDU85_001240 [Gaertneriomyces sp. JEL0708]
MTGISIKEVKKAKGVLVAKGFLPIPANDRKYPLVKTWKNYKLVDFNNALNDISGVHANIGCITGPKSNIVVIDIDNKKPAKLSKSPEIYRDSKGTDDWQELVATYGEPQTLKSNTPSGGTHYYFQWDDGFADQVATTASCVIAIDGKLCAIDSRGDGGFIMTPPSVISEGQYAWQPTNDIGNVPISPIPEWLKKLMISTRNLDNHDAHQKSVKASFADPFENQPVSIKEDFELFKRSDLFKGHECLKVDQHQRLILKETKDFDCDICKRTHVNHSNHPFLVRRDGTLLFVCRPSAGDHKFVAAVKDKDVSKEGKSVEPPTPHQILMQQLWAHAKKEKLLKYKGFIYKPISPAQPAAYIQLEPYADFVNNVLTGSDVFTSTPRRFKDVMDHLQLYNDKDLSFMKVDKNILACRNGCLLLEEAEFVDYTDERIKGKAARHYVDADYKGSGSTPTFDSFIKYQLSEDRPEDEVDEIFNTLLALIGRLFFNVNQCDRWAVALCIIGAANTGKSTFNKIIEKMFAPDTIGIIASNWEEKYGNSGLHDKELIVIPEIPSDMHKLMNPTQLQTMVTGERTSIVGKHKDAFSGHIPAQMVVFGNFFFSFTDSQGCITRRFPIMTFHRAITNLDSSILDKIVQVELMELIFKCVSMYKSTREKYLNKDFWDFSPEYFKENMQYSAVATNHLYRYLTSSPDGNKNATHMFYARKRFVEPVRIKTSLQDVKKAFHNYMKFNHQDVKPKFDENDYSAFKMLGYEIKTINICKGCNKQARGGRTKCCKDYGTANRVKRTYIYDLELVREETTMEVSAPPPMYGE